MKPKDFKSPFRWEGRHVLIQDQVWFVPDFLESYSTFTFPGWNALFNNNNPVNVEYCSGNGNWIIGKAQENPNINWVAVEIKFERVRKIWSKAKNAGLTNIIILCGEALTATQHYFPSHSVNAVFINFPDPWPKRRHAKHRLIAPPFVEQLHRIMQPEAVFTYVTDDPDTSELAASEMLSHPAFRSLYPDPYYINDFSGYGTSYFEELWRSKGKSIRYLQFNRQ